MTLPAPITNNRANIQRLEDVLQGHPNEEVECPLKHIFTPGLYCREIYMPAGSVIISKIHKTEHVYIISKGKVLVVTENDKKFLQAPHTGVTVPGTKRALYILEDTIWTTMHPIESTDLDEIEEALIAPSFDDLQLTDQSTNQLIESEVRSCLG